MDYLGLVVNITENKSVLPKYIPLIFTQTIEQKLGLNNKQTKFLNDFQNRDLKKKIENFIKTNNSVEDKEFAKLAIDALIRGVKIEDIDFDDRIILDFYCNKMCKRYYKRFFST